MSTADEERTLRELNDEREALRALAGQTGGSAVAFMAGMESRDD